MATHESEWKEFLRRALNEKLPFDGPGLGEWVPDPLHKNLRPAKERRAAIEGIKAMRTRSVREWLETDVPEHVRENSGKINISALRRSLQGWCDKDGVLDLIKYGVPISNTVFPETNIPGWKRKEPTSLEKDDTTVRAAAGPVDEEVAEAVWADALEHVRVGNAVPIDVGKLQPGAFFFEETGFHASYQFGIRQSGKVRPITDARGTNKTVRVSEKMRLPTHQVLHAAAHYMMTGQDISRHRISWREAYGEMDKLRISAKNARQGGHNGDWLRWGAERHDSRCLPPCAPAPIEAATLDIASAFRHLSPRILQDNVFAVKEPGTNEWRYFRAKFCLFGHLSSIHAWCRVAEALRHAIRRDLGYDVFIYIDDTILFIREGLAQSAILEIKEYLEALGFSVAVGKTKWGKEVPLLGLVYDLRGSTPEVRPPPEKLKKAADMTSKLLSQLHEVTPTIKAKQIWSLTGHLNFLNIASRYAQLRCIHQPLYDATYGLEAGDIVAEADHEALTQCCRSILAKLASWPAFRVAPKLRRVTIITDAAYVPGQEATLSAMIVLPGQTLAAAHRVPFHLIRSVENEDASRQARGFHKLPTIALFEAVAILVALKYWKKELHTALLTIWTDSAPCLFALIKGFSKSAPLRVLVGYISQRIQNYDTLATLRYVPSRLNPTDGATREDTRPVIDKVLASLGLAPTMWPADAEAMYSHALIEACHALSDKEHKASLHKVQLEDMGKAQKHERVRAATKQKKGDGGEAGKEAGARKGGKGGAAANARAAVFSRRQKTTKMGKGGVRKQ
jgi:hypothetical protein